MVKWNNWSGKQGCAPDSLHFARSEEDIQALVAAQAANGKQIRVAGAGHSHFPLVANNDTVLDLSGLQGVISTDKERRRAWVWAGTPIHALGRPLHDVGLALHNQGDIDRQAIAGAVSTGTHGTGRSLKNLASSVKGLEMVLASGERVQVAPDDTSAGCPDGLFEVARLSLGAAGVITRLLLECEPSYRLKEAQLQCTLDEAMQQFDGLAEDHRHVEFFWYPQADQANLKITDHTEESAQYPVAEEGQRVAWSYEVLPNHRPHLHTEMEYSVPAERGFECLAEIRDLLHRDFPEVAWPVEYRRVAADDIWLSMASARDTVTISVHQDIRVDDAPYFRACEAVFKTYGGRPHWGKVHYLDGASLAACYPRWGDWWDIRDAVDPQGMFLNDWLRSVRP